MKRLYKIITFIVVILIIIFLTYSYFNVKGSDIKGIYNISSANSVEVLKNYSDPEIKEDFLLDSEQIEELKELILDSDFTRVLSSNVSHSDTDEYLITIKFDNDYENDLRIDCIGNEYINVLEQFNRNWLRINNPDWYKKLEEIIGKSY